MKLPLNNGWKYSFAPRVAEVSQVLFALFFALPSTFVARVVLEAWSKLCLPTARSIRWIPAAFDPAQVEPEVRGQQDRCQSSKWSLKRASRTTALCNDREWNNVVDQKDRSHSMVLWFTGQFSCQVKDGGGLQHIDMLAPFLPLIGEEDFPSPISWVDGVSAHSAIGERLVEVHPDVTALLDRLPRQHVGQQLFVGEAVLWVQFGLERKIGGWQHTTAHGHHPLARPRPLPEACPPRLLFPANLVFEGTPTFPDSLCQIYVLALLVIQRQPGQESSHHNGTEGIPNEMAFLVVGELWLQGQMWAGVAHHPQLLIGQQSPGPTLVSHQVGILVGIRGQPEAVTPPSLERLRRCPLETCRGRWRLLPHDWPGKRVEWLVLLAQLLGPLVEEPVQRRDLRFDHSLIKGNLKITDLCLLLDFEVASIDHLNAFHPVESRSTASSHIRRLNMHWQPSNLLTLDFKVALVHHHVLIELQ